MNPFKVPCELLKCQKIIYFEVDSTKTTTNCDNETSTKMCLHLFYFSACKTGDDPGVQMSRNVGKLYNQNLLDAFAYVQKSGVYFKRQI